MARPSFKNIGLRRDLNLADLTSKDQALNNVLNNLVVGSDNKVFTGGDLDAIKGISNSTVTNRDIGLMAGLAVKNTVLEDGELVDRIASPVITVKNQLDTIIATTNDPPFFNGGDGLIATFFDTDQINTNLSKNTTGTTVIQVGEAPLVTKQFWNNGVFEFSNKLDDTLGGANGLIQWTGFYVPDASGPSTFSFETTGLVMFEVADEFGDLQVVQNTFAEDRQIEHLSAMNNELSVTVDALDARTVIIGDEVIAAEDENGVAILSAEISSGLLVDGVGNTTITLNQAITVPEGAKLTYSIRNKIGSDAFRFSHTEPNLEKYVPIEIRLTYWYSDPTKNYFNKYIDCNLSTNIKDSGDWPYWYLYQELPDEFEEDSFKGFYDNRLLTGGGEIGPTDVNFSTQYARWLSVSPLTVTYSPPRRFADALRAEYTVTFNQDSNILSTTSTSPYTDNIEIGNQVITPAYIKGTSVSDISRNNIIIVDSTATGDATVPVKFMDHRGFLDVQAGTSNNFNVTVTTTEGLKVGTVVVSETNPAGTDYIRVTSIVSIREFTTNIPLGLNGLEQVYFYSDKGLRNNSLNNFCIGTIGKEIAVTAVPGDTVLTLNNVSGFGLNNVFQSRPYTQEIDPTDNTTLTRIIAIDNVNNTVTLNKPVQPGDDMVAGTTVVICPTDTTQDKEACVIPLNTAPPFVGTLDGLRTTDGTGATVGLQMTNASAILKVRDFVAENANSVELSLGDALAYDRTIPITFNGTVYKVLASTS
jgi:hypothetical protein|tara:strand:- start:2528 stop:4798 length:2271 start_codon:yes stop_codon:yes gene_type:complete